jgi:hypothetical protein
MKKMILLIGIISAVSTNDNLGTFKKGDCIQLYQTCDTCTYVNLTSIIKSGESSDTILIGKYMDKNGYDYNYTYCPDAIGEYKYNMIGDKDGVATQETIIFSVTPSGNSGTANIAFFILVILLVYGITFVGFFGKNEYMTILGAMAMIFLGVYLFNNGIIIFRDDLTRYLSYLTMGIGAILAIWTGIVIIQENLE